MNSQEILDRVQSIERERVKGVLALDAQAYADKSAQQEECAKLGHIFAVTPYSTSGTRNCVVCGVSGELTN